MKKTFACLTASVLATASHAVMISEFEPNPAGGDPSETTFELFGTAGESFDLWILSIENDGYNGTVDRAAQVAGTFDANGLAVVTTPDLENPTFTVVLTDAFTGAIGDDLDAADDGTLDLSSLGTILDAVAVSDEPADDAVLYGETLGGTNVLYNGEFEPLSVFRDASSGVFYQTVTVDFRGEDEHIGIFAATGGPELDAGAFSADPTTTTFGAINPTLVPEPASVALLAAGGLLVARRRRA